MLNQTELNEMTTQVTTRTMEGTEQYSFGVTDHKGRTLGACVTYVRHLVEPAPVIWTSNGCPHSSQYEAGSYYCWYACALRDGKEFGAGGSWPTRYCTTEAERTAQVQQYLKDAEARATRKFPPTR